MAEDGTALRMHPDDLAAMIRALAQGPVRLPMPPSEVPTGLDAKVVRDSFATMSRDANWLSAQQIDDRIERAITERFRDRHIPSSDDIRAAAKDVAATLFRELIGKVEGDIRTFLTEQEIEAVVYRILTALGMPADEKDDRRTTRETIEALFRGHRMRSRIGSSFVDEIVKALVGQLVAGSVLAGIAAVVWKSLSAGAHP